jgi:RHS repeat-associated protein
LNATSGGSATTAGSKGSSYSLIYTPITSTSTDPSTGDPIVTVVGGTTTVTNTNGKNVQYVYDANGFNTQVIDQLGKITKYSYDTDKNSTSVQTPLGLVTQYFYDTRGNLTQVKSPADSSCGNASCISNVAYNNKNKPVQITSPSGRKARVIYDNNTSRVLQIQAEIDTAFLTSGPDGNGNYPTLSFGDGRIVNTFGYAYNGYPPSSKADANGNTYTYDYDGYGNLKRYTTASGKNRLYVYNALNTLTSRTDPDGSTYTYSFDNLQRTLQVSAMGYFSGATSPQTLNYYFGYDNNSNLLDVYPPLITYQPGEFHHHYTYDADNRLTNADVDVQTSATATPVRKKEYQAIYDQNPGCDGTDLRGLLTGSYNYFPYDANRSETPNAANGSSNPVYCYNNRSTLSSFLTASLGGRLSYTYDDDDKLTRIDYPNPNQPPSSSNYNLYQLFKYDNLGRQVGKEYHRLDGTFVANFASTYNSDGQITYHGRDLRFIANNGMNSNYSYYRRGWLKQSSDYTYTSSGQITSFIRNFAYDLGGRRVNLNLSNPSANISFTYNVDDQVTQVTNSIDGVCENRAYTDNGNLSQRQYCYSAPPKDQFVWGAFDRLTGYYSVNSPGTIYNYQFFPDASLASRGYSYVGTTPFGTDPHQLYLTKNGGQSTGQTNTDAAGINSINAKSVTYNVGNGAETTDSLPIYDLFGDRMQASISSSGGVLLDTANPTFVSVDGIANSGISPYQSKAGAYQSSTQPAVNTWRGAYGYFDPRTTKNANGNISQYGNNFYQLGNRWYDPLAGQFISRDSDISQPAYQYANNDPVNSVDPSGNAPIDDEPETLAEVSVIAKRTGNYVGSFVLTIGGGESRNPRKNCPNVLGPSVLGSKDYANSPAGPDSIKDVYSGIAAVLGEVYGPSLVTGIASGFTTGVPVVAAAAEGIIALAAAPAAPIALAAAAGVATAVYFNYVIQGQATAQRACLASQ